MDNVVCKSIMAVLAVAMIKVFFAVVGRSLDRTVAEEPYQEEEELQSNESNGMDQESEPPLPLLLPREHAFLRSSFI
jgi:hypothetical protein